MDIDYVDLIGYEVITACVNNGMCHICRMCYPVEVRDARHPHIFDI
jgi:hypothetical protein